MLGVFGDLYWDTPPEEIRRLAREEPAVLFVGQGRYVVLQRFPEGIRFYAAPAPIGASFEPSDLDCWDVGTIPDVAAVLSFIDQWLAGASATKIQVSRTAPRWRTEGL